jgi:hypothetical protein
LFFFIWEKALHPHISSWGSLLRLYGSHSLKTVKEKKQEEQQITLLQSKAAVNAPNYAILNKLRQEMLKLRQMRVRNGSCDRDICWNRKFIYIKFIGYMALFH